MSQPQTIVGIDIAKSVFQIHEVDKETGEVTSRQIKRARLLQHFINREPCFIGMEACGGAQHWARQFVAMGHTVKLLPAQSVRPFVGGNKNDAADARAIWTAVQQPGIKAVAIKTEAQQAVLALHRMRQQLVKFRTAQINALRGLLAEYGEVMPLGRDAVAKALPSVFARLVDRLPGVLIESLREQYTRIAQLDKEVSNIERRLQEWHRDDESCRRITAIPGVGLLTATATVAAMGDPGAFSSGREFAAWLGLVPRQTGTGGRVKLLGISKRGDRYLRTLLIHGARSVLMTSKTPPAWAANLAKRRPLNVAVVALANKMARTLWALLAHQRAFQSGYVSRPA
ncbi:IS110 family transposase [Pseudomonas aeruginosa]|uniref:IS110 family transposase n=1 Tax=Pseudomonas aeruginosa TaxID=287 RepID=UPI00053ED5C2|nr:IS110 family transposase [Pseudomonas aeruginosa]EMB9987520.1 IS110 family transposase [Pseudomonas aeruginosa]KSL81857.1 IS110 family transposase [Pseudomonas aeruginosa]KSM92558.1 IS110 family transposase [Pseudomonas aeruginosa]KSN61200.1 IS110 family transposase [Pseudomonas aeruginosa]MBW3067824.1 IS110 family transposase [Pseudomonas aeruginosa]